MVRARLSNENGRESPRAAPTKRPRAADGIETIDGYHVARWSDANLAYVAVSDMDEKTLGEFVEAFRRGGGPATEPPVRETSRRPSRLSQSRCAALNGFGADRSAPSEKPQIISKSPGINAP
jgi:hypothetical protein